ncbi:hypothetical protein KHQ06_14975 [Nocardia tengchongensis]|uniref:DUF3137 domain-containing protein n=1 Tax=Nocardia tengchongensis TaxID=2055889 RepID=A0ABX8D0P8_9NOCA|nr:hypothetical protein [Nocardia tengchongensis]QVI23980.1 hypothetical protein KHQ06_14975 [Nocardia tengchongensis]
MEVLIPILGVFLGGPLVLVIVLASITSRIERDRKARVRQWAIANGWRFQERAYAPWTNRLPGRNRLGLGVTVTGMMGGRWVTVAEYHYQTTSSSGDSTTTHTHRYVAVLVLLDRPHPWLAVRRRGLMSQFGRALFGDKPTATGNVMFDSQYRVEAADAGHAKAMVSPPLIAAHIAGMVPQWSLVGNELLAYAPAGVFKDPNMIPGYAGPLMHVADLLGPVDFSGPSDR